MLGHVLLAPIRQFVLTIYLAHFFSPLFLPAAHIATIAVCASGGDYPTISTAIQNAAPGDVLSICAGTYPENLVIDQNITLEGEVAGSVIIDGQSRGRVITLGANAVVTLRNLTIVNGLALDENGGGILNAGALVVEMSTIRNNMARNSATGAQAGGGIYNSGVLQLINSLVLNNLIEEPAPAANVGQGGGIFNSGSAQIMESVVRGNGANGQGGGIYSSGALQIERSEINANGADATQGGGVFSSGLLEMTDSVVHDNLAFTEGGLALAGPTTIQRSTIYNHDAPLASALGVAAGEQVVRIVNSTISGNQNNHPVLQGAVVVSGGQVEISNSTLANNPGGNLSGAAQISNSIFVADEAGINCTGAIPISLGHNLESGTTCGFIQSSDRQNANADLLPLESNSVGLTPLHPLGAASQAVDAGDCSGGMILTDQRGVARPQGAACDIGSYEKIAATTPSPTPTEAIPATPVIAPTQIVLPTPTLVLPTPTPVPPTATLAPPTATPTPTGPPNTELVSGRVWNDLNGDAAPDESEPGIANVQINLVVAAAGALISRTRTDENGLYRFYILRIETQPLMAGVAPATLPAGWLQTFDADGALDNKARLARDDQGRYTQIDFGYAAPLPLPTGQIGGRVWMDANQNGLIDGGESGLADVQVNLVRPADGSFVASTRTDADGAYGFEQLAPRDYMVGVARSSLPPGIAPTFDNDGHPDNKFVLNLADGQVISDVRFGYRTIGAMTSAEIGAAEVNASSIELAFLPLVVRQ
ncbi:MAG: SdrD B-like domain-containing protein [Caldilineaceae bacterium]